MNDFKNSLIHQENKKCYPNSISYQCKIPIYSGNSLRSKSFDEMAEVQKEWVHCWLNGAGVIVVQNMFPDTENVDSMTKIFMELLETQEKVGQKLGDHFAEKGANARLWNSLEKAAVQAPEIFITYYQNPLLGYVCEAWLGPGYQVTSQVNLVFPGGKAQLPHRDYHLGFTTQEEVKRYPLHVQTMSAFLTLQGAVAHVDMPLESGPTRLLPFSQRYDKGYQLYHDEAFIQYFDKNAVQLPLKKGDGVFFSPALMHAAGGNTSAEIKRLANLLQISSAFAKPMESINHSRMQLSCFEALKSSSASGYSLETIATVLSNNYPFPTNIDRDNTLDESLIPKSTRDILLQALKENWSKANLEQALSDDAWRHQSH